MIGAAASDPTVPDWSTLPPAVLDRLAVGTDPLATWQSRATGGMSAGAYCAVDQGLRHPDVGGAIISIEGYDNPDPGGSAELATNATFVAYSPGVYVNTMSVAHPVPVFFRVAGNGNAADRQAN